MLFNMHRKQDPYQRILLWLDDLELNQLYPVSIPKDPIQLEIDNKGQDERKNPILPPLKAPCNKQIKSEIAPCHKETTIPSVRKQSQGTIASHRKESVGEINNMKEMKLIISDKSKATTS